MAKEWMTQPGNAPARAIGPVRAALMVVDGTWTWYRRNWRATVVSGVVQPVLFLLALGFGLGSQVTPGAETGGLAYVVYLAPALLVATAVQIAAFESTYPVLSAFRWQQTYLGIAASPITPGQIFGGHLLWVAARLTVSGAGYLAAAAALCTLTSPSVLLSLPVAVLSGLALAAPVAAYSATLYSEGQQISALFRFVVVPMTLFAGTFFPVTQLPGWAQPLAWATPLWHGTELSRGAALGHLSLSATLGHLAFLLAMLAVGTWLGVRTFTRRLAA
ncbi:ABC transporter permease [Actinophytocola oryzae]|uniref:Transport permease protein n=1 Tax=Actinophytocola oryzae TaxID=502181 RepID=A0A4R7UU63_9PSEU|nr:ABC transporter permease [Actinophytocola oryzae]TDV38702.1 lipooligosaccharide transport system permease protein [Actinophytocola oryzae]